MKLRSLLIATALAESLFAVPLHGQGAMVTHTVRGKLVNVVPAERLIVVASATLPKPLPLKWDAYTGVYVGRKLVPLTSLARGQAVEVSYRLPTFGDDYASRIVLLSPNKTSKPNPQNKP